MKQEIKTFVAIAVAAVDRLGYTMALQIGSRLGIAWAQNNLGAAYEHGSGVAQDYIQASDWYLKAAEQGDATAQIKA